MSSLLPAQESPRPAGLARWPWRGLGWALLLALLGHVLVFELAQKKFSFSFDNQDNASNLNTMSTRWIESATVAAAPSAAALPPTPNSVPAPAPKPAVNPAANNTPALAEPPRPAQPQSSLQNEVLKEHVAKPKTEQNLEPNEPIAGKESAQGATEIIANPLTDENEAAPAGVISLQASSGAGAASGIKLKYPPNAQLQFDATYKSKGLVQSGSGVLSWKSDGNSYAMSLEATALVIFNRTEKSSGQLSPMGLAPERYSSIRTGRSEQATHFRPEIGVIQFSNNKPDAVLMAGAQDRLSALVQLAGILGGDPERYKIVNRIQMQVAGLDNAEVWEFNLQGVSDITLPAANMQALKISRTPRNEFDQRLEIWLSPQLGYLPIRIRQSSATAPDQEFTDLVLRKLP
jgi:Protein of unknown function (DUF3108)